MGADAIDPWKRRDWCKRASTTGAYRYLNGYDPPAEPIGSEPAGDTPDKRAAWHHALASFRVTVGPDVRGLPDGALLHMCDTYPAETAWAPRGVGAQLRQVPPAAQDAPLAGPRAAAA